MLYFAIFCLFRRSFQKKIIEIRRYNGAHKAVNRCKNINILGSSKSLLLEKLWLRSSTHNCFSKFTTMFCNIKWWVFQGQSHTFGLQYAAFHLLKPRVSPPDLLGFTSWNPCFHKTEGSFSETETDETLFLTTQASHSQTLAENFRLTPLQSAFYALATFILKGGPSGALRF